MATDPTSSPAASRKSSTSSLLWWLTFVGRLFIGVVFAYAAYSKLPRPSHPWMLFAMSVDSYQILPEWAVEFVARTLPWAELVLGAMLILGLWVRWAAAGTTALLAVFVAAIVRAYAMGLTINCGCFGTNEPVSRLKIFEDSCMLAVSLAVTLLAFRAHRRARQSA